MTREATVLALEPLVCVRVVATVAAIDAARWPGGSIALRVAPDEVLVISDPVAHPADSTDLSDVTVADPHAIIERDTGWCAAWVPSEQAIDLLERACRWEPPRVRPAFAQGALADCPVKIWFEPDRVLFVVAAPFAADLEARLR